MISFSFADIQILPFEMSQSVQEAQESTQNQMDEGIPQNGWQRADRWSEFRVRETS